MYSAEAAQQGQPFRGTSKIKNQTSQIKNINDEAQLFNKLSTGITIPSFSTTSSQPADSTM